MVDWVDYYTLQDIFQKSFKCEGKISHSTIIISKQ